MKFCEKCDSKLIETIIGSKCPKCDDLSQIPKKDTLENKIGTLSSHSFPFEKNLYYKATIIRNILHCDKQSGISYNEDCNFLTLFRYAHKHVLNTSNPYLDYYDDKSGNYYYVGKGATGDQSLTGVNEKLSNAKDSRTKIHLFWQHASNSDHQYLGEMNMQECKKKDELDIKKSLRKVYVFTLNPV